MPELPEVETTRRGLIEHVRDGSIGGVVVRESRLRWPVPADLGKQIVGKTVRDLRRRGKYLLFDIDGLTLIVHLGMSGSLRIVDAQTALLKHDHIDIEMTNGKVLRFNDPRRFGAVLWCDNNIDQHSLLVHLGPEPLTADFDGDYLYKASRKRKATIKTWIMDSRIVVGVGNIYASEALFHAGIRPGRAAGRVTAQEAHRLAGTVKDVLSAAIEQGGTTLRDFVGGDGKPGYFQQTLFVYGRAGEPCRQCDTAIKQRVIAQRSSFYCPSCQR